MQISALLIVESPTIAKIIDGFQLSGLNVVPTAGYSWKPKPDFIKGTLKGVAGPEMLSVRNRIRSAARNASRVIVATDTDPSGEFIAMCLARELKNKRLFRCYLNLMSPKGVSDSVEGAIPYQAGATISLLNRLYVNKMLLPALSSSISPTYRPDSIVKNNTPLSETLARLALYPFFFAERAFHEFDYDGWRFTSLKPVQAVSGKHIRVKKLNGTHTFFDLHRPWNTGDFIKSAARKEPLTGLNDENSSHPPAHFAMVQNILNRLFTTVPDEIGTGLISYPRTNTSGFYRATWQHEYDRLIRSYPAEEILPTPLWMITPDDTAHESLRPLNMGLPPEYVRPLLRKDLYDAYSTLHNAASAVFRKPASAQTDTFEDDLGNIYQMNPAEFTRNPNNPDMHSTVPHYDSVHLIPVSYINNLFDYLDRYALMPASSAGKTLDNLINGGWVKIKADQVFPGDQLYETPSFFSKVNDLEHILETLAKQVFSSEHPSQLDALIRRMISLLNELTHG